VTIDSQTDLSGFGTRVTVQRPVGATLATGVID
jgi:hypothetical protein